MFSSDVQAKLNPDAGDSRLMPGGSVFTGCFSLNVPVFLQLQRSLGRVALKTTGAYTADMLAESLID